MTVEGLIPLLLLSSVIMSRISSNIAYWDMFCYHLTVSLNSYAPRNLIVSEMLGMSRRNPADKWPWGQERGFTSSVADLDERLINSMPVSTFPVQCGVIFMLWYKMLDDIGTDYVLDISSIRPFEGNVGTGLLGRLLCSDKKVTNL